MTRGINGQGPDWTDIGTALNEIERNHDATIKILVEHEAGRYGCGLRVILTGTNPAIALSGGEGNIRLYETYPTSQHKTMEGLVYNMLLRMDTLLSQHGWKQYSL